MLKQVEEVVQGKDDHDNTCILEHQALESAAKHTKITNCDLVNLPHTDTDSAPSLAFRTVETPENSEEEQSVRVRTEYESSRIRQRALDQSTKLEIPSPLDPGNSRVSIDDKEDYVLRRASALRSTGICTIKNNRIVCGIHFAICLFSQPHDI